jgi:hypothetical protein
MKGLKQGFGAFGFNVGRARPSHEPMAILGVGCGLDGIKIKGNANFETGFDNTSGNLFQARFVAAKFGQQALLVTCASLRCRWVQFKCTH